MVSKSRLVQTVTSDDLILSGLYFQGSKEKEALIYIHGFTTDFYTHKFPHVIAKNLALKNTTIVLAQTRGTGNYTEILKSNRDDSVYLGSFYEKLEEAHLDISAWINFLRQEGYSKFILVGHSLGTIKCVRYLFEGEYKKLISKLILLAPFDKNGYVERKTKGEWHNHLKIAENLIKKGKGLEIIPYSFDDFPMTYQTYYSWYKESDLNSMWDFYRKSYNFPILNSIEIPVKVIVGDKDTEFFMPEFNKSALEVKEILKRNIKNCKVHLIKNSEHNYVGFEAQVSKEVENFIE